MGSAPRRFPSRRVLRRYFLGRDVGTSWSILAVLGHMVKNRPPQYSFSGLSDPTFRFLGAPPLLELGVDFLHFVRTLALPSATTDVAAKRCRGWNTRRSTWSAYDVLLSSARSIPTTIDVYTRGGVLLYIA